ncbi:MAG: hypothetical protein JSW47_00325 [Phycisphaerales bacterium]|nr:MAG: hypothetical protein JSW47_00325 [Phycisphaerales bacterium]UCF13966.1 MAG: hypothetical protein JSW59_11185 [Phycisphaerales bacterium]
MSGYKIFMLIAVPALAIAWIVYWLRERKIAEQEKNQPRKVSQRLTKSKSEVSDWAKKMADFKPPKRKFESDDDEPEDKD